MDRPLAELLSLRNSSIQLQSANDYRSYRIKLTKKVAKIRKDLKIQARPTKGTNKLQRKQISSEDFAKNVNHGSVLLYLAERSWAHGMESKSVLDVSQSKAQQKHVISKFAKTVKYLNQLTGLATSLDSVSSLELYTYLALVEGTMRFQQRQWPKTIKMLSIARVSLQVLNNRSDEQLKELFRDTVSTLIDPMLSYAVYQSNKSRSVDILTLSKQSVDLNHPAARLIKEIDSSALEVRPDKKNPSEQLGLIQWRDHSARVQDPDLASSIINAQSLDSQLASTGSTDFELFDKVLQGWQEAMDVIHETIERIESSTITHDEQSQETYVVGTYINYNYIFRRIQRDILLIKTINGTRNVKNSINKKLEMNRDVVRIYDTILQSTKQLVELPGVHNDEELHSALTIVDNYFKLQRTNVIAKTYGICGNRNEALALYKRSLSYFETDVVSINIELPGNIVSQADIDSALGQTRFEFTRAHALANLNDQASTTTTKKVKGVDNDNTVINSLFDYPGGEPEQVVKRLVDFNYKLQPVPVKPVFFDIAYNYIDYNEQEKAKVMQQEEPRQQQQQQQKKGFLGLWR